MNRNFEVAKILSTLAGFIIVASSLYFSLYQSIAGYRWDITTSKILDEEKLSDFAAYSIKFESQLFNTGRYILIIGIILVVLAVYFTYKGYKDKK